MANENTETSGHDVHDQAAQHTLAANPLVGVRGRDVVASARTLLGRMASNPTVVAQQWLALIGELGRIATGASELARRDVGTPVFGGMIFASFVGIFAIPPLYVMFQAIREKLRPGARPHEKPPADEKGKPRAAAE